MKDFDSVLLKSLPADRKKRLVAQGVSGADFIHGKERIEALDALVKYEVDLPRMPTRTVSIVRQIAGLEKICRNPNRSNYVLGISSFPTDALAKHLAIHLMDQSYQAWQEHHKPGRTLPVWHRVYGGFGDALRDKTQEDIPSLLIISNVNESSSAYKLEKVRDLLDKYSNIPRIVVIGGGDPITFFTTKLHHPLNVGLFLGPQNRIKEL